MQQLGHQTTAVRESGASAGSAAKGHHYQRMIEKAKGLPPLRTAVVHPVDVVSLRGAIEATEAKLIVPVLVGP